MKEYRKLYYNLYCWSEDHPRFSMSPNEYPIYVLSVSLGVNLITISAVIGMILGRPIDPKGPAVLVLAVAVLGLMALHYRCFGTPAQLAKLRSEFVGNSRSRVVGLVLISASLALLLLLAFAVQKGIVGVDLVS